MKQNADQVRFGVNNETDPWKQGADWRRAHPRKIPSKERTGAFTPRVRRDPEIPYVERPSRYWS